MNVAKKICMVLQKAQTKYRPYGIPYFFADFIFVEN
jgi:hypothetical protein